VRKSTFVSVLLVTLCALGADPPRKLPAGIRLVQPWSKLSDLTDQQTTKLDEIHRKARDQIKAIEQREQQEMMAVLTPRQQAELREMQDQELADKKLKAASKQQIDPTTLPAEPR
jgi:Spy/CpxP family protein refolding chaperone